MTNRDIWRGFASDNYAGAHPEVLTALASVNEGHQKAYGADEITAEFEALIRRHFGDQARGFPVFNGTGANVTALMAMAQRWEAVICAKTAHINADEGGAPEKVGGLKLWQVPTPDGKLTPELIALEVGGKGDVHRAQPAVVYISQSTEMGTIYSVEEIRAITEYAHAIGLKVFLDGARLSNAAVALGLDFGQFTTDLGVDALSFGMTKNGAIAAEAVVELTPGALPGYEFIRKSAMQLASKMRFVSAQYLAMLNGDLWRRNAQHANDMAHLLSELVKDIPGVTITQPVQANAVFAILPSQVVAPLQERYRFYIWNDQIGEVRLMCSFDTTETDVREFAKGIAEACISKP